MSVLRLMRRSSGISAPRMAVRPEVPWHWRSLRVGAWIALALLEGGRARHGATLWAVSPLAGARTQVRVGPPTFVDPEGARLRA